MWQTCARPNPGIEGVLRREDNVGSDYGTEKRKGRGGQEGSAPLWGGEEWLVGKERPAGMEYIIYSKEQWRHLAAPPRLPP